MKKSRKLFAIIIIIILLFQDNLIGRISRTLISILIILLMYLIFSALSKYSDSAEIDSETSIQSDEEILVSSKVKTSANSPTFDLDSFARECNAYVIKKERNELNKTLYATEDNELEERENHENI